jgi:L-aspartate oxidase
MAKARDLLQRAMTDGAGVVRSAGSLDRAAGAVAGVAAAIGSGPPADRAAGEVANLVTTARSVLASATLRTETRGAHARSDYPEPSAAWRCRIVHRGPGGGTVLAPAAGDGPDGDGTGRANR